jgi:hypothetical protein
MSNKTYFQGVAKMVQKEKSPLTKLLTRREELDEYLLCEILEPFIQIQENTGEIILTENYQRLNKEGQTLTLLLAQKARARLGLGEKEELGPRELAKLFGLKVGTVAPILRRLERDEGLLVSSPEGKYTVPNRSLKLVKKKLQNLKKS